MSSARRGFLGQLAVGAVALAVMERPVSGGRRSAPPPRAGDWDLSWVDRIAGQHRALFDVAEVESGRGFFRALIWRSQYIDVLGARADDLSTVVVFRHHGIALAMSQAYWDRYRLGKELNVRDPFTDQSSSSNPVMLPRASVPAEFGDLSLSGFLAGGGIALACDLAFKNCVSHIAKADGVDQAEAERRAAGYLIPGVVLQPSGVFAAVRAQQAGCAYVRSS